MRWAGPATPEVGSLLPSDICYYTLLHITLYYYLDHYNVLLRSYIIITYYYMSYYNVFLQILYDLLLQHHYITIT